jgi:hypothetical protein
MGSRREVQTGLQAQLRREPDTAVLRFNQTFDVGLGDYYCFGFAVV